MSRLLFVTTLSLVLLTACRRHESSAEAFTLADSAGVSIVESFHPLWESGEGWTLSREPEVVIGQTEGDDKYVLIRVTGVRRLSDGRIAILDAGSSRLRIYDSTGRHLMDLGGEGDGPSEFRHPQFLGLVSDTLLVYDQGRGGVTWFSPEGQFVRTDVLRQPGGSMRGVALVMFGFLDERFLIGKRLGFVGDRSFVDGLNRAPWPVWRFDVFDSAADSLFSVPGAEQIISRVGSAVSHRPHVFGKFTQLATSQALVYVAPTDAFSIQVLDREGILRRIIRRAWTPRRTTPSDLDQWVEHEIERRGDSPEERAEMRRTAGELSVAETMPAFRWITVDSEDHLWVEEWENAGLGQGSFSIFRSDGAWLGHLDLPEGLPELRWDFSRQLIEIGADYLLGVWTDDYDVEQVRLYRIDKR